MVYVVYGPVTLQRNSIKTVQGKTAIDPDELVLDHCSEKIANDGNQRIEVLTRSTPLMRALGFDDAQGQ